MATENAISAVSRSLVWLLAQGCPKKTFGLTERDFMLAQAVDLERKRPTRGLSVLLHRVTLNVSMRDQSSRRRVLETGPRALPVELHYLITPWAETAEVQQSLLGWVIRFFERCQSVSDDVLNQVVPGTFGTSETVQIVPDAIDGVESRLSVNGIMLPPSAYYVARLLIG
jgi:hypothetical protein